MAAAQPYLPGTLLAYFSPTIALFTQRGSWSTTGALYSSGGGAILRNCPQFPYNCVMPAPNCLGPFIYIPAGNCSPTGSFCTRLYLLSLHSCIIYRFFLSYNCTPSTARDVVYSVKLAGFFNEFTLITYFTYS
jgi:hypothetical protein